MNQQTIKTYVAVTVFYDPEGTILPLSIHWRDGHIYTIDKVLEIRAAASLKSGGCGTRFSCRIQNTTTHLFFERGRWFVEEKTIHAKERNSSNV